jgi:hypothetical protein
MGSGHDHGGDAPSLPAPPVDHNLPCGALRTYVSEACHGLLAKLAAHFSMEAKVLESRKGYAIGPESPTLTVAGLGGKFPLAR